MKKIIVAFKAVGALGVIGFWDKRFFFFSLFYLVAVILGIIERFRARNTRKEEAPASVDLRYYYLTLYLSLLNPFNLAMAIMQLLGQLYIRVFRTSGLPTPQTYRNKAAYILPFKGTWKVARGGVTRETSHSWDLYTQRYAYDFYMSDDQDKPHRGSGTQPEDYYCFDQDVIAPADGVVAGVKNNIRDYKKVGDLSLDWMSRDFRGNYIVIRHHENEYSFIAHFKKGSIVVKKGDVVKQGQVLGKCGNSGHSTMPHIHYHLQDSKYFWTALGLPVRFDSVNIDGAGQRDEAVFISTAQQVANHQALTLTS